MLGTIALQVGIAATRDFIIILCTGDANTRQRYPNPDTDGHS